MQLQCFKHIGCDQSYCLTIWGRMVVFQRGAICEARTEGLIVLVQSGAVEVCVCVCVFGAFKLMCVSIFDILYFLPAFVFCLAAC